MSFTHERLGYYFFFAGFSMIVNFVVFGISFSWILYLYIPHSNFIMIHLLEPWFNFFFFCRLHNIRNIKQFNWNKRQKWKHLELIKKNRIFYQTVIKLAKKRVCLVIVTVKSSGCLHIQGISVKCTGVFKFGCRKYSELSINPKVAAKRGLISLSTYRIHTKKYSYYVWIL